MTDLRGGVDGHAKRGYKPQDCGRCDYERPEEGPSGIAGIKPGPRKGEPRTGSAVIGLTANRGVSSGPETESASPAG